jgi:hypothetical protein
MKNISEEVVETESKHIFYAQLIPPPKKKKLRLLCGSRGIVQPDRPQVKK